MKVTKKEQRTPTRENGTPTERFQAPRADIVETEEAYVLTLDMPGVAREGLEISVDREELVITGRKSHHGFEKALLRESVPFGYRRVFALESLVDREKVQAKLDQGVLRLELPKAEAHKPRKIQVS